MTTILDICTRALRAIGELRAGDEASGHDGADAMLKFQAMVNDLPGLRKGRWTDVILTDATTYEAADGERVSTSGFGATITLPTTYTNDSGTTVLQKDLSRVMIIGGAQAGLWLFSQSNAAWAQVDDLDLETESPFGPEDDAGLIAMLALELAPDYSDAGEVSPIVIERAARQQRSFRARFRRAVAVPVEDALMSRTIVTSDGLLDLQN